MATGKIVENKLLVEIDGREYSIASATRLHNGTYRWHSITGRFGRKPFANCDAALNSAARQLGYTIIGEVA